jgi:hypothetical protein
MLSSNIRGPGITNHVKKYSISHSFILKLENMIGTPSSSVSSSPSPKQLASARSKPPLASVLSSSSTQTNQTNDYPTSELCRASELHRVAYSEPDFLKLLIHHSLPRPKPMSAPKSAMKTKITTATTVPILSKGMEDSSTDLKMEDSSAITKVPQKSTTVTLTKKNQIRSKNQIPIVFLLMMMIMIIMTTKVWFEMDVGDCYTPV